MSEIDAVVDEYLDMNEESLDYPVWLIPKAVPHFRRDFKGQGFKEPKDYTFQQSKDGSWTFTIRNKAKRADMELYLARWIATNKSYSTNRGRISKK